MSTEDESQSSGKALTNRPQNGPPIIEEIIIKHEAPREALEKFVKGERLGPLEAREAARMVYAEVAKRTRSEKYALEAARNLCDSFTKEEVEEAIVDERSKRELEASEHVEDSGRKSFRVKKEEA